MKKYGILLLSVILLNGAVLSPVAAATKASTQSATPTVSESETMEIEVHIVNFQENLYGSDLEVQFLFKIRNEMSFETAEELKAQIEKDKAALLKRMPGV